MSKREAGKRRLLEENSEENRRRHPISCLGLREATDRQLIPAQQPLVSLNIATRDLGEDFPGGNKVRVNGDV